MIYYLPKNYKFKRINDAGSKARIDIEKTMDLLGYIPTGKHKAISKNRLIHFIQTLITVVQMPMYIKKGDILILQYPVKYYRLLCFLVHLRKAEVITIIHDLECFRKKRNSVRKEIELMNMSDAIICHNPTMNKWLCDNGFKGYNGKGILVTLNVFDFLSDSQCTDKQKRWPSHSITYAGQLAPIKNKFLYEIGSYIENYTMNVYGKGFDKSIATCPEKFDIKGFMLPDKLISCAEGDFGLVWDGGDINSCDGNWGEYLKINTPHKVSLYIRCGLPIIIWRKAAMAQFVEENEIGICVDSLKDINNIYKNITKDEYVKMCDNVLRISYRLSEGWYCKTAISEASSRLKEL